MFHFLNKIHFSLFREMVQFALIGLTNLIIDFSLYLFLTRSFSFWQDHYLLANFFSFSCAVIWSFFLNKHWTFRNQEKKSLYQSLKFFSVSLVGLGLTELILFLLIMFGFYDILAKIIAVIVVYFWNFGANKYWTFRFK